jgi:hypothetical protein
LAAYVDQQLIGAERERVESHLVKCDSCLQQVGFLVKHCEVSGASAPSSLVLRAKELQTAARTNAFFAGKLVSVAAGIAVLVVGLVVWREARPNTEEHSVIVATTQHPPAPLTRDNANSSADTAVRSESKLDSQPLVLSPQPGAMVHDSDFTIRWEPVPNSTAYEVRVVTADGGLVWRKRLHESSVSPPKQTLRTGMKYFVWVRVWLANGKTQQSPAVGFIGG